MNKTVTIVTVYLFTVSLALKVLAAFLVCPFHQQTFIERQPGREVSSSGAPPPQPAWSHHTLAE